MRAGIRNAGPERVGKVMRGKAAVGAVGLRSSE